MDWEDYYNEGIALKEAGDFERSAAYHLKVLELEPALELPEAWHNAGAALLRINKREEALPYLYRALQEYDKAIAASRKGERDYPHKKETGIPMEADEYIYGYEREDPQYYFFWKACVYALLRDKKNMLLTLTECLILDAIYVDDADEEEDFTEYREDKEFRQLLELYRE